MRFEKTTTTTLGEKKQRSISRRWMRSTLITCSQSSTVLDSLHDLHQHLGGHVEELCDQRGSARKRGGRPRPRLRNVGFSGKTGQARRRVDHRRAALPLGRRRGLTGTPPLFGRGALHVGVRARGAKRSGLDGERGEQEGGASDARVFFFPFWFPGFLTDAFFSHSSLLFSFVSSSLSRKGRRLLWRRRLRRPRRPCSSKSRCQEPLSA